MGSLSDTYITEERGEFRNGSINRSSCKHFVTFRHHQAHVSPVLTRSAPVRATYDPGRRPTAMAYEVSTTIEIAATPENVWAVLADLASYPKWHPMYLAVSGQLAAGRTLTITSTHPTTG